MAYSGKFRPKNIGKYKGNVDKITYRSSWEAWAMKFFRPVTIGYSMEF